MSRHDVTMTINSIIEQSAEEYVNFLAAEHVPKAMTLDEVKQATKQDVNLQTVADKVRSGNWNDVYGTPLQAYKNVKMNTQYPTTMILS